MTAREPSTALDEALREERNLREQLADLIARRQQAEREAERLERRSELPGADDRVAAAAVTLRDQAATLAAEIDQRRRALRAQEGLVAELRAGSPS